VRPSQAKRRRRISLILKTRFLQHRKQMTPPAGKNKAPEPSMSSFLSVCLISVCAIRCELEPTSAEIGEAFYSQENNAHLTHSQAHSLQHRKHMKPPMVRKKALNLNVVQNTSLSVCPTRCKLEPTSAEMGEAFYSQENNAHLAHSQPCSLHSRR